MKIQNIYSHILLITIILLILNSCGGSGSSGGNSNSNNNGNSNPNIPGNNSNKVNLDFNVNNQNAGLVDIPISFNWQNQKGYNYNLTIKDKSNNKVIFNDEFDDNQKSFLFNNSYIQPNKEYEVELKIKQNGKELGKKKKTIKTKKTLNNKFKTYYNYELSKDSIKNVTAKTTLSTATNNKYFSFRNMINGSMSMSGTMTGKNIKIGVIDQGIGTGKDVENGIIYRSNARNNDSTKTHGLLIARFILNHASEAGILSYNNNNHASGSLDYGVMFPKFIKHAIDNKVDIINIAEAYSTEAFYPNKRSFNKVNNSIKRSIDAGIVWSFAVGNLFKQNTGCITSYASSFFNRPYDITCEDEIHLNNRQNYYITQYYSGSLTPIKFIPYFVDISNSRGAFVAVKHICLQSEGRLSSTDTKLGLISVTRKIVYVGALRYYTIAIPVFDNPAVPGEACSSSKASGRFSGIMAMLLQYNKIKGNRLSPRDIVNHIFETADYIETEPTNRFTLMRVKTYQHNTSNYLPNKIYGYGIINVKKVIDKIGNAEKPKNNAYAKLPQNIKSQIQLSKFKDRWLKLVNERRK